ncbi:hypothetical protein BDA96_04G246000 [Sorghum bicolor]|uniref:Secreted protein n=1 Tax=Sorghum bicolor TaxID=4558 RepID=A0A921UJ48_SORBI|nr:hypothetical protein BDA96_04G246000 [Sorghum bicolor]
MNVVCMQEPSETSSGCFCFIVAGLLLALFSFCAPGVCFGQDDDTGGFVCCQLARRGIVSGGRAFRALDSRHRQRHEHEACLPRYVRHAETSIHFAASRQGKSLCPDAGGRT